MNEDKKDRITSGVLLAIIALGIFWLLRLAGGLAHGWYMLAALAVALLAAYFGGMLHGMKLGGRIGRERAQRAPLQRRGGHEEK